MFDYLVTRALVCLQFGIYVRALFIGSPAAACAFFCACLVYTAICASRCPFPFYETWRYVIPMMPACPTKAEA